VQVLIRFLTRTPAGSVEHSDKLVDVPAVTIGRATDQVLKLRDKRARLQHATIHRDGGELKVTSPALAGVTVNGRSQREASLSAGDTIEVGANIIRILDAPHGVDVALSFELSADASEEHFEADWSEPAAGIGGWGKRRMAWTLVGIVAVVSFAIPALSLLPGEVASIVRGTPMPDDGLWLAGPVHSAHSTVAEQCESCHVHAFQRVPDSACMDCHTVGKHVAEGPHAVLGDARCASCHLEHNQPPQLVKRQQALCADCHEALPADVELDRAGDFLDAHPGFRVSLEQPLPGPDGGTAWQTTRLVLADAGSADQSNLKFDHAVHLDPDGILTPDGNRVVDCDECHRPEPGGARMQPVSMDEHCAGCHTLSFDPDDPSRSVPHGDAQAVVQALIEYYSARLLGEDPDAVEQRLRRPGRTLTREDRDRAAAEARQRALEIAGELFERRACINCHEVTRNGEDAELPWHVKPVRLTDVFLPRAYFTHGAHDTDVMSCDGCHAAGQSTAAGDVLIPDIDNCRECHGSGLARRNSGAQIPSTCIMCHGFHFETKGAFE